MKKDFLYKTFDLLKKFCPSMNTNAQLVIDIWYEIEHKN